MLYLKPIIEQIHRLLAENSEQSVTYAALEARLALERICYDRLRQRHDYIAHSQLKRWQPGALINQLLTEVDEHATHTRTLSIAKQPAKGIAASPEEFVNLGTEVGFDPKQIAKLWNALSRLALHVKLPKHKNDDIEGYGDTAAVTAKVEEALVEIEKQAAATMSFSGLGETVSFDCGICGEKNRRRTASLREGKRIFCVNPECESSWTVKFDGTEIGFVGETCDFNCQSCNKLLCLPWRFFFEKLKFGDRAIVRCGECDHVNYVEWRLTQVAPPDEGSESND